MGDHEHHRHPYHKYYHPQRTTLFLPMLCSRPSLKDVSLPRWRDRTASFSADPSSPRIGCMGQVKRNNKIAGLPSTQKSNPTNTSSAIVKYSKLTKIFSAKNLSTATPDTVPTVSSCKSQRQNVGRRNNRNENYGGVVSIDDMDPPLPVIKQVQKTEEARKADSLWKRRSGGVALKSLQLQQIHHPRHLLLPTSV